jgi:hypothetical protein
VLIGGVLLIEPGGTGSDELAEGGEGGSIRDVMFGVIDKACYYRIGG